VTEVEPKEVSFEEGFEAEEKAWICTWDTGKKKMAGDNVSRDVVGRDCLVFERCCKESSLALVSASR